MGRRTILLPDALFTADEAQQGGSAVRHQPPIWNGQLMPAVNTRPACVVLPLTYVT